MMTPANNDDERRQEARLPGSAILHIEVESGDPDAGTEPVIISCHALDLSANGLQVEVSRELPKDAILQMLLHVPASDKRFLLTGEVMWVQPAETGQYLHGFRLFDSEGTEIIDWKTSVSDWLE